VAKKKLKRKGIGFTKHGGSRFDVGFAEGGAREEGGQYYQRGYRWRAYYEEFDPDFQISIAKALSNIFVS